MRRSIRCRKRLGSSRRSVNKTQTTTHGLADGISDGQRQAKQNADELLQKKIDLEKEKKNIETEATEKEKLRDKKCKTIGNYVHESVPENDNEVGASGYVAPRLAS